MTAQVAMIERQGSIALWLGSSLVTFVLLTVSDVPSYIVLFPFTKELISRESSALFQTLISKRAVAHPPCRRLTATLFYHFNNVPSLHETLVRSLRPIFRTFLTMSATALPHAVQPSRSIVLVLQAKMFRH